jgi:2',3'-cyclic-nucleotide 2'-phosphodiesterase (5'-nucleotidase family)
MKACFSCALKSVFIGILYFIIAAFAFAKPINLTILYDNDVHGHLLPFNDNRFGQDIGGAARRATLIKEIEKKNPNTIALSAGDWISGTPVSGLFKGKADWKTLNIMDYKAIAIGNHEFDYGQTALREAIKTSKVPFLAANIYQKDGSYFAKPYIIINKGKTRIAIVGLTTPETPIVTHPKNVEGLEFEDPAVTIYKLLPTLKEKADIIIVLSHLGYEADIQLAKQYPKDIQVIVGGHSHTKIDSFNNSEGPVIVQAYQWGTFLGKLDVTIDNRKVLTAKAKLFPINSQIKSDPAVESLLKTYTSKIDALMTQTVGTTLVDLVKPSYTHPDTNLACWITDVYRERMGADMAMQNTGGTRASINKGPITYNDVYTVLPFENSLVLLEVSGLEFKEILDDLAKRRLEGKPICSISGVTFLAKDGKANEILINGKPFDKNNSYTIAVNDFIANGGDGYTLLKQAKVIKYDTVLRDIIVDYLKKNPVISPEEEIRIRLE